MIHPPSSKPAGVALLALGLASVGGLAINSPFRTLGPCLGFPLIVVALGVLGKPGQFARRLAPFVGSKVRVEVFGRSLPDLEDAILLVDAIECLGFGLWIRLRLPSGRSVKLKVAQPTTLVTTSTAAEMSFAGYIQWDSRRIKGADGRRAPGAVQLLPLAAQTGR